MIFIYFLITGFNTLSTTYFYNFLTNSWTRGPTLLNSRAEHSCAFISNTVIVVGGFSFSSGSVRSTEYLNTVNNTWVNGPNLPYGINGENIVPHPEGGIVIVGGYSSSIYDNTNALLYLPNISSQWTVLSQTLQTRRQYSVSISLDYNLSPIIPAVISKF